MEQVKAAWARLFNFVQKLVPEIDALIEKFNAEVGLA
jgi:hypothetical protein